MTERIIRRDGRPYPAKLDPAEHQRLIKMAHEMHCHQRLSVRATQRAMAGIGVERSLGALSDDLTGYECTYCREEPEPAPTQPQPEQVRAQHHGGAGGFLTGGLR